MPAVMLVGLVRCSSWFLQSKGKGGSGTMPVTAHPYKIILLGYFTYFFLLLYTTVPVTPRPEASSRPIQRNILRLSPVSGVLPVAGISTAELVAAPYVCIALLSVGGAIPSGSTDPIAVCTVIVALLYTLTGRAGSCNIESFADTVDLFVCVQGAFVTVTTQVADWLPACAVMVAVPTATAVTLPVSSTVATAVLPDVQVTVSVVSVGVTVAVSVSSLPV